MWIFRVDEPRLGVIRIREWRRRASHTVGLLVLLLGSTVTGLVILDQSHGSFPDKMFTGLWDGVNLVTTLGSFTDFSQPQKVFMLLAMVATLLVGGFAVSRLTGMLSGDDVMAYRENRIMEHKLEQLADHVVVVGFHSLGALVANRLHEARETVLVIVGDKDQADRAADRGHLVVLGSPRCEPEFYRREYPDFTYEKPRPHAAVLALMATCDVFCLPSIVEGRALVIQEAMSAGLPAIVTAHTGADDAIEPGRSGFVVPIRSPGAIAEKIAWFADRRAALPDFARAAQAAAARFTWHDYGERIAAALATALPLSG